MTKEINSVEWNTHTHTHTQTHAHTYTHTHTDLHTHSVLYIQIIKSGEFVVLKGGTKQLQAVGAMIDKKVKTIFKTLQFS